MRAYERLLNYVRVYTTSDPESGTHPRQSGSLTWPASWWRR